MPSSQETAAMIKFWGQARRIIEKDVKAQIAHRLVARKKMLRREIAQDLGISRQTLNEYLKEQPPSDGDAGEESREVC